GRTTGLTRGRVRTLHATVQVEYGEGRVAIFTEQVVTTAMSQGGDSGSLILDRDGRAVGLLFAGSDQATIFSPIGAVERLLGVRVAGKALTAGTR
ncbi:MAG: S1 family peptidase, partial [Firmicutes bacterium]|nr:S1 family peptidase [Bacillota bacterium]